MPTIPLHPRTLLVVGQFEIHFNQFYPPNAGLLTMQFLAIKPFMSEVELKTAYKGQEVQGGDMDVTDLAQVIMPTPSMMDWLLPLLALIGIVLIGLLMSLFLFIRIGDSLSSPLDRATGQFFPQVHALGRYFRTRFKRY